MSFPGCAALSAHGHAKQFRDCRSLIKLKGPHCSLGMVPDISWPLNHPQVLSSAVLFLQTKSVLGSRMTVRPQACSFSLFFF